MFIGVLPEYSLRRFPRHCGECLIIAPRTAYARIGPVSAGHISDRKCAQLRFHPNQPGRMHRNRTPPRPPRIASFRSSCCGRLPCLDRIHGDLLRPIQNVGQRVGAQHSLLEFTAARRNDLGCEKLPQSCGQLRSVRLMIRERLSET